MSVKPSRDDLVMRAKLAERIERYSDLRTVMKALAETGLELNNEERNALSTAYRFAICKKRTAWRVISSLEQKDEDLTDQKQQLVHAYREKIEREVLAIANEVTELIDKYLMATASSSDAKIFYLKMKADYNRYLAEIESEPERQKRALSQSEKAYKAARDLAMSALKPVNPVRLGIALNYSVFLYEIKCTYKRAIGIAKEAFDEALKDMSILKHPSYKDSCIIIQLLRDNIKSWSSENK